MALTFRYMALKGSAYDDVPFIAGDDSGKTRAETCEEKGIGLVFESDCDRGAALHLTTLDPEYVELRRLDEDGDTILCRRGSAHHRTLCDPEGLVNVKTFLTVFEGRESFSEAELLDLYHRGITLEQREGQYVRLLLPDGTRVEAGFQLPLQEVE